MRIAEVRAHVPQADLSQPFAWSFDSVIGAFRPHLLGAEALAGERIWMELHGRFRDQGQKGLMITALSGIDVALWDVNGKYFQARVHVLMGGALRERVMAYATGTYRRGTADAVDDIVADVWGTGVGLAAALQLIAVRADNPPRHTPLAPMLEFDRSEHPFRQAVLTAPIEADADMVAVPEAVGLGIAIDRGALERFRKTPDR
jgi:L-alanine-DL-glutamate epimerase-like enolase superfamily enzyme